MLRLIDLVGSPLSVNALREDLQATHKIVASWLDTLDRLSPFSGSRLRRATHLGGEAGTEARSLRLALVADLVARFRKPGREPPAEMGPLGAGHARP